MVYLHSPTTSGGSLVAGAFLIVVMWDAVSHTTLLSWGARAGRLSGTFASTATAGTWRPIPMRRQSRPWGRLYILATTIAGCIWGSAGLLFYVPESTLSLVYLCLVLFGVASLTIPTLSLFSPAFYPLVVLVLLPFIVRSVASGHREQIALAIPLIIALVMALTFGRKINQLIDESIRRRFENQSLIEIAERARLEAERSNRAKSRFLATMSHELRTPLNSIIGYSELMTQHPARFATESAKDPLERILRAGRHLLNLINELLDIAKIEAGKTNFVYEARGRAGPRARRRGDDAFARRPERERRHRFLSGRRAPAAHRRQAADAGRPESPVQCVQIHRARTRRRLDRAGAGRWAEVAGSRGDRHRHRHDARTDRNGCSRISSRATRRRSASSAGPGSGLRSAAGSAARWAAT